MDSVVEFSAVARCAMRILPIRLGPNQRATNGWHTVDDQLFTSNGFGTTLLILGQYWRYAVKSHIVR
jgi:hypothetical protein